MKAPHASIRLGATTRQYPAPRLCAWSEIQWDHKLAHAHLFGATERPEEAMSILRELQRETEAAHHRYFLIRVEIRNLRPSAAPRQSRGGNEPISPPSCGMRRRGSLSDHFGRGFDHFRPRPDVQQSAALARS